jgi:hypothetical protein
MLILYVCDGLVFEFKFVIFGLNVKYLYERSGFECWFCFVLFLFVLDVSLVVDHFEKQNNIHDNRKAQVVARVLPAGKVNKRK